MSETLAEFIARHECRGGKPNLKMYKDSLGIETIGYGHNLRDKPITKTAADQIFLDDLTDVQLEVTHTFPWYAELSQPRQWVILDMCFNLGLHGLLEFRKFLKAVEMGAYETAANEMVESRWFGQVKGRGIELAQMMRGSESV
ncbi:MAG: glycoside hydrolase family protein [Cetobacterium sp.]